MLNRLTRAVQTTAAPHSDRINRRGRPLAALAVAALGTSLLAGCGAGAGAETGSEEATGDSAASGELQEITFLSYLPMETLSMVPEMMAVSGGYFEKHGLDVEIQEVKGSPQAMQLLLSGAGDITRIDALDTYNAVGAEDMPLRNVGTLTRNPSIKLLHSSEAPLESPEDFVGKTIGVPSEGGSSSKTVSLMLQNAGIDPSEVEQQVVGLTPATFQLVQNGTLAGYMVSHDSALIAQTQNDDALIYDFSDALTAGAQVYVTTPESIEDEPEKLKKYLAAIKEATAAIVADEDLTDTIETLRSEYDFATLMDDDIARAGLEEQRRQWTNGGESPLLTTDEAEWQAGYEELVAAGDVPDGLDSAEWVDNSLLPE
ncbi:ABC transporter substrate-binding protein [Citricoccus sp. NPDC055426]|uniref:ABC transporter substrate-binding protein n=1 Tax=Citricoccus sp. NPDC055426 TaxID=3155536 RepID=UPI003432D446